MSGNGAGFAYAEVSAAAGTWTCPLTLPAVPLSRVQAELVALARRTGWPVAAFAYGDQDGDRVGELLLYRDTSRTHGTPPAAECDVAASALAAATGWTTRPATATRDVLLIGLGLREGYRADAPQHTPGDVERLLACDTSWTSRAARLVSARAVEAEVRWYDEPGVVVQAPARLLPAITAAVGALQQHRFVVTDHVTGRTYALALQSG